MRYRPARQRRRRIFAVFAALGLLTALVVKPGGAVAESRRTAIVEAVEHARLAIVNIHGEKTVEATDAHSGEAKRRVNGMGTGVLIDQRGYIITNHHVVDGVRKIMVSTFDGENYVARLVSHDPKTDLALIKVDADHDFQVIHIGTSADLMAGETVIAVGNAFGYEHTVTRGIISALHRTVQVSDSQNYEDLIQTDASINPGNSGGPLLNIEGDMIGVNVAVRAGAQGIGFAIPADKVLAVATDLISTRRLDGTFHGLVVRESSKNSRVVLGKIESDSPAGACGLESGDTITAIDKLPVERPLDVERALLGHQAGETVNVSVLRKQQSLNLKLTLAAENDSVWELLGLRLESIAAQDFQQYHTRYRGGLSVADVRPNSPAAQQRIRRGDILVGMHVWETISIENVVYILGRPDFAQLGPLKFYILRGNETLFGHLTVAQQRQQR
jgi:serine protease Do